MGQGFLRVEVTAGSGVVPIGDARVVVMDAERRRLYDVYTDAVGRTASLPLEAPDKRHTFDPEAPGPYYRKYYIMVEADGYSDVFVDGVKILDTSETIQPVAMAPLAASQQGEKELLYAPHFETDCAERSRTPCTASEARRPEGPVSPEADKAKKTDEVRVGIDGADDPLRFWTMRQEGERIGIGRMPPRDVLRQDDKGELVIRLQFALSCVTLFHDGLPVPVQTGVYDARTITAVMGFQAKFGLPITGLTDAETWQKLYDVYWGIQDNVKIPGGEKQARSGAPLYPGYLIQAGTRGQDVVWIQQALNCLCRLYESCATLEEDGIFGPKTEGAVKLYQKNNGRAADGIVGPATWKRLMEMYLHNLENGETADYPGEPLRVGSLGEAVRRMQNDLNRVGRMYPDIPPLVADGIFGSRTEAAVNAFQKQFGMVADGVIGPATWSAVLEQANSAANAPIAVSTASFLGNLFTMPAEMTLQQAFEFVLLRRLLIGRRLPWR